MRKTTFLAALIGTMAWTQANAGGGNESAAGDAAQDTRQAGQEATQETQQAAGEAKQETQQAAGQAEQQAQQVGRDAAAETQQTARAATQGGEAKKSVLGEVKSIDGQKLTLENRLGETHDFALGSDTKFMRDGKAVSRDEIQEGAQVRASFTGSESENDLQATRIDVMESGGTASPSGASGGTGDTMGGSGGSSGASGGSSGSSSGSADPMGGGSSSGSSGSTSGGTSPSGSDRP
jgi:hypothetical protein